MRLILTRQSPYEKLGSAQDQRKKVMCRPSSLPSEGGGSSQVNRDLSGNRGCVRNTELVMDGGWQVVGLLLRP